MMSDVKTLTSPPGRKLASLLILAGGRSSRFGTDKSQLQINGKLLVQTLVERLGDQFAQTVIVSDYHGKFQLPGIAEAVDTYQGRGPLGGLEAGIRSVYTPWVLLLACDMPAVEHSVIERLLSVANETHAQAVVPYHAGGYEPLCALYSRDALPVVQELLRRDAYRPGLLELLERLAVAYIRVDDCFFNINTPRDAACTSWKREGVEQPHKRRYRDFFQDAAPLARFGKPDV